MPRRTKNAKTSLKTPTRRWHQRMVRRIKRLAEEMRKVGADMDYYGGFGEIGNHGRELLGAAKVAKSWAKHMEVKREDEPYGRNGGVVCDTNKGPCACGAWH